MEMPDLDEINVLVNGAIARLLRHDKDLLSNNANERSITHRLAMYLQDEFPEWHVDAEYNRDGENVKLLHEHAATEPTDTLDAPTVFPDIIIHRRGEAENLLVIEAKKSTNATAPDNDWKKLQRMTVQEGHYKYEYGLWLLFDVGKQQITVGLRRPLASCAMTALCSLKQGHWGLPSVSSISQIAESPSNE